MKRRRVKREAVEQGAMPAFVDEVVPTLQQKKRGSNVDHAGRWLHANVRPAFLNVKVRGSFAQALLASKERNAETIRLDLSIEYECGTRLHFGRSKGQDEFIGLYRARGTAKDRHKLLSAQVSFVSGASPSSGVLPLWDYFALASCHRDHTEGELSIRLKFCTNLSSKQHQMRHIQIGATLSGITGDSVAAYTHPVPFLCREPQDKPTQIDICSDCRPGDLLVLASECIRPSGCGTVKCQLQRDTDGEHTAVGDTR